MSAPRVPKEPLIAVIGTTGTGKSDLAVELAVRFNGEVINADAMQMYKGLPIITNQLSQDEQRGIPHHLLAAIDPLDAPWSSGLFAQQAKQIIKDIRARGKLPIVAGGSHAYIHALFFAGSQVDLGADDKGEFYRSNEETISQFPILGQPTEVMLKRLREVDPVMAERWHPDDQRKIKRSLEIFLTTGKRASDIYAEQKQVNKKPDFEGEPWETLMFWVYTETETLKQRLNRRVDKMEENGLMKEVREQHGLLLRHIEQGEDVDRSYGIWQSIGFKQMEPFLEAERRQEPSAKLEKLKAIGLEEMRAANRQYARAQLRWIRHKTMKAAKLHVALDSLYLLDSTSTDGFQENVLKQAADLSRNFLEGVPMPQPTAISDVASEVLASFGRNEALAEQEIKLRHCDVCDRNFTIEKEWISHINGRSHRQTLKKKRRTALVQLDQENSGVAPGSPSAIEAKEAAVDKP
ncbi:IPP transferase-domain-containing protein [Xylariaceae sp. FL0016]|nr:IPP transferase-domain-containing protein [Xylariaceae sp. FL0016]